MIFVVIRLVMVLNIFQCNARSLIVNKQELKKDLNNKPDVICSQNIWLRPHLDFVMAGYNSVRHDEVIKGVAVSHSLAYRGINASGGYE